MGAEPRFLTREVRTNPFFSGLCFCGARSAFLGDLTGISWRDCVLDHLDCAACGARFFFKSRYKHTETDGVDFYEFVQLDHDPNLNPAGGPVLEAAYR